MIEYPIRLEAHHSALCSVNERLLPRGVRTKNNRVSAYMFMPDYVKEYKESVTKQFKQQLEDLGITEFPDQWYEITMEFYFTRSLLEVDTCNYIKLPEDALSVAMGINDSRFKRNHQDKFKSDAEDEYVVALINICTEDL